MTGSALTFASYCHICSLSYDSIDSPILTPCCGRSCGLECWTLVYVVPQEVCFGCPQTARAPNTKAEANHEEQSVALPSWLNDAFVSRTGASAYLFLPIVNNFFKIWEREQGPRPLRIQEVPETCFLCEASPNREKFVPYLCCGGWILHRCKAKEESLRSRCPLCKHPMDEKMHGKQRQFDQIDGLGFVFPESKVHTVKLRDDAARQLILQHDAENELSREAVDEIQRQEQLLRAQPDVPASVTLDYAVIHAIQQSHQRAATEHIPPTQQEPARDLTQADVIAAVKQEIEAMDQRQRDHEDSLIYTPDEWIAREISDNWENLRGARQREPERRHLSAVQEAERERQFRSSLRQRDRTLEGYAHRYNPLERASSRRTTVERRRRNGNATNGWSSEPVPEFEEMVVDAGPAEPDTSTFKGAMQTCLKPCIGPQREPRKPTDSRLQAHHKMLCTYLPRRRETRGFFSAAF